MRTQSVPELLERIEELEEQLADAKAQIAELKKALEGEEKSDLDKALDMVEETCKTCPNRGSAKCNLDTCEYCGFVLEY